MELDEEIVKAIESIDSNLEKDPEYYRAIAYLWAGGATQDQISVMIGKTMHEVKNILALDRIKQMVFQIQKGQSKTDAKKIIKSIVPDAIEVAREIMLDQSNKAATRANIAFQFMDRAMGRPTQTIDVGGSLIKDLFERLDNMQKEKETKEIEAEVHRVENVEDAEVSEKDKITKWVDENL